MAGEYPIVCMDYIFCIQSSVHEHLGCFHVLTNVNSAAMDIGEHLKKALQIMGFFLDICPEMGLLNYMVALFLVF